MSKTIDEKVVSMQFDNKDFEKNVSTTMSTLDKLKQSLHLDGATKGLEGISAAANKVDMSGISSGVETVRMRFSALEVMAVTALANITNSAVNAGKRMASALTIDPIKTGFQEYETQINAVQTILANTESKGSTLKDVNKALDELNTYADKTIYNFTEMTRNIGTFTAAGVDLKTSTQAIKGIANLAAVSGSTSQQASTAMYQLSQALASGTVKLQDWNSVVNAGMGGQVFQDALKETARVHGIKIDQMIKKEGSFRETLSKGWLTSDILTETLNKFTGDMSEAQLKKLGYNEKQIQAIIKMGKTANDAATKVKTFTQLWDTLKEAAQSGWTQTWEIIIGDFEEAKDLLTNISDVVSEMINKTAEARNNLLQGWKDLGGRTALIDGLANSFEALMSFLKPIGEAFREIFPATTAQQLYDFTIKFRDFTKNLIASEETAGNIKKVFSGFFIVLKTGINFVTAFAKGVFKIVTGSSSIAKTLLSVAASIGEFVTQLGKGIDKADLFGKTINGVIDFISGFFKAITGAASPAAEGFIQSIKAIAKSATEAVKAIGQGLLEAFKDGGINSALDALNSGLLATILLKFKNFINDFLGTAKDEGVSLFAKLKESLEGITGVLDSVRKSLEIWQQNLKTSILLKIASAIGILTLSLVVLSSINSEKLSNALGAITTLFIELMVAMNAASKLNSIGISGAASTITTMIGMATAVLILSSSLKKLSGIKTEDMKRGLLGVASLLAMIIASCKILSASKGAIIKGSTGIISFSIGLNIMALACKQMSSLNYDKIGRGLVGIGGLLLELAAFAKLFNPPTIFLKASFGIIAISTALMMLEVPFRSLANMKYDQITNGLMGIGGLLLELAVFINMIKNIENLQQLGVALNIMSAALFSISKAMVNMKDLSYDQIKSSLLGVAGALTSIVMAVKYMPKKDLGMLSIALPAITTALIVISKAITDLSKLSWGQIASSLTAIASSFTILIVAAKQTKGMMRGVNNILALSSALLIMGVAIKMISSGGIIGVGVELAALIGTLTTLAIAVKILKPLVPSIYNLAGSILAFSGSLVTLGIAAAAVGIGLTTFISSLAGSILILTQIDPVKFAKGLLMLAAAFAVIGVSANLLKGSMGAIMSLAGSIATLGLSFLAVGLSISLVTAALSTLAVVGKEGVDTIISALTGLIKGIIGILPEVLTSLLEAGKVLILGLVDLIVETAPAMADGFLKVVTETLKLLVQYGPQIINFLLQFVIDIINGLADNMPKIVQAIGHLLESLFSSIASALGNADADTILKVIGAVGMLTALTYALSGLSSLIPSAMVGVLGMGVVIAELSLVLAAIGAFAQIPGLQWLISEGGNFLQAVGTAIGQFIGGIAGGIMGGMSNSFPQIGTNLSEFMTNLKPFLDGAKSIDSTTAESIKSLASAILVLTAADVLDGITSWLTGGSSISDFGKELPELGKGLSGFSESVKDINAEKVKAAASAAKALAEMASYIPNEGGLVAWFTGDNSVASFADKLPTLGEGLNEFSKKLTDVNPDNIKSAASAAKALAEMASTAPEDSSHIISFGENLKTFGDKLKSYFDNTKEITADSVAAVSKAIDSVKQASSLNADGLSSSASAIDKMVKALKAMSNIKSDSTDGFVKSLASLSKANIDGFVQNVNKVNEQMTKAGKSAVSSFASGVDKNKDSLSKSGKAAIDKFSKGISDNKKVATEACTKMVSACSKSIKDKENDFYSAGSQLVTGFANGISANTFRAKAKAKAMAEATEQAARKALDINSPSKVFRKIGSGIPEGFAQGITMFSDRINNSTSNMANSAIESTQNSLSRIADVINSGMDIDSQPTIRPVVDLSDVQSGASAINGMLSMNPSVGVLSNIRAINSAMNSRNQNGSNDDVVSAINGLKKAINNSSGDTYQINGVTYDDGSNITDAVKTLVRAAKVERRK